MIFPNNIFRKTKVRARVLTIGNSARARLRRVSNIEGDIRGISPITHWNPSICGRNGHFDFIVFSLDFGAPGLDFIALGFDFVAPGLDFVAARSVAP
jgi:hypothetical protein